MLPIVLGGVAQQEGVWFIEKGEVLLSGDKWRVIVSLNVTKICGDVGKLQQMTAEIEETILRAVNGRPYLESQLRILRRIQDSEAEMWDASQALMGLLPQGRVKRGWFNLGKVLKVIFGTPDEQDLRHLEKSTDLLERQTGDLVHLSEDHLTLTRQQSRRTEENTKELMIFARKVTEESARVRDRLKILETSVGKMKEEVQVFENTTSMLIELELVVFKGL